MINYDVISIINYVIINYDAITIINCFITNYNLTARLNHTRGSSVFRHPHRGEMTTKR